MGKAVKQLCLLLFLVFWFYTTKASESDSEFIYFYKYKLVSIENLNFKNYHELYMTAFTFCSTSGEKDTIRMNYITFRVLAANPIGNFICPFIVDSIYEFEVRRVCVNQLATYPINYYTLYMDMRFKTEDCTLLKRKKMRKVLRLPKPPYEMEIADHNYVDIKNHLFEVVFIKCSFSPCINQN